MYRVQCVYSQCSPPCKAHIPDDVIKWAKRSLHQIMASPDVTESEDPLQAFLEILLNFHSHYCKDLHSSKWCKYHPQVNSYIDTKISTHNELFRKPMESLTVLISHSSVLNRQMPSYASSRRWP